jgi:hypothetical protein
VVAPSTRFGISSATNDSAGSVTAEPPPRVSPPVCWMEFSHITATVPSPWWVADTPDVDETTPASGAGNIWSSVYVSIVLYEAPTRTCVVMDVRRLLVKKAGL